MDEYLAALDRELRATVVSPDPVYEAYYGMFRYHLGWTDAHFREVQVDTGKRLRPLLCLLSCEAVGGDWRVALPVAVAIELTHNFSLIHDDIEDQSDERRGRAAVWKIWGLAQGLNAGDGMFVLARLTLDRLSDRGLGPEKCAAIGRTFDAATLALCHGQFLDLGFEARLDVSVDEYLTMIRGKSAALIGAATRIGAMLTSEDARVIDAFTRFGENIGISFQIADDILGIWGDSQITGKSAATDILSKKKSLPVILGLQRSKEMRDIYRQERLTNETVTRILQLLDSIGAREHAQRHADGYRSQALAALNETGIHNRAIDRLREFADLMTHRVR